MPPRQRLRGRNDRPARHGAREWAVPFHRLVPRLGLPAESRRGDQGGQRRGRLCEGAPSGPTGRRANALDQAEPEPAARDEVAPRAPARVRGCVTWHRTGHNYARVVCQLLTESNYSDKSLPDRGVRSPPRLRWSWPCIWRRRLSPLADLRQEWCER